MTEKIRVVIIEDQWMVRDGLAAIANVAADIEVVAIGGDGREALSLAAEHKPDVILMDIKMPNLDGLEATRRIKSSAPEIQVLVLTTFIDRELIAEALSAGAAGYLTKDIAAADLADGIRTAAKGLVQLTSAVASRLVSDGQNRAQLQDGNVQAAIDSLTRREREVLRELATGASNAAIAARLNLSSGTIKNHVSSIFRHLDVHDRTKAALLASEHDLS